MTMERDVDFQSVGALQMVLSAAIDRLSVLTEPVVVAACPNKHDDTGRYPDWLGVQVGRATWERADYRDEGDITENARNPEDLSLAREILQSLQESAWRSLVKCALGLDLYDEVVAIVMQHGETWLVISASNSGQNIAFLVGSGCDLVRVGQPERLDERLGHSRPLLLERIEPSGWPLLRELAAFPVERSVCPDTADARNARLGLAVLVQEASSRLQTARATLTYIAASERHPDYPTNPRAWRTVSLDSIHITRPPFGDNTWYENELKKHRSIVLLDHLIDALEVFRWRDLFSRGVMRLPYEEPLGLLARDGHTYLIASQTAVFTVTSERDIVLVGACDRICSGHDVTDAVVFLFDAPIPTS